MNLEHSANSGAADMIFSEAYHFLRHLISEASATVPCSALVLTGWRKILRLQKRTVTMSQDIEKMPKSGEAVVQPGHLIKKKAKKDHGYWV